MMRTAYLALLLAVIFSPFVVSASQSDGTILSGKTNAQLLSTGASINFGLTAGNVHVTDQGLTGYAWGETTGWINLSPSGSGVVMASPGSGTLSGYAWGEITGWINFAPTHGGVSIGSDGKFSGYAWSENAGWITFNCAASATCVQTDWVPLSSRNTITGTAYHPAGSGQTNPALPPPNAPAGPGAPLGPGAGNSSSKPLTPPSNPPNIIPTTPPPAVQPPATPPTIPIWQPVLARLVSFWPSTGLLDGFARAFGAGRDLFETVSGDIFKKLLTVLGLVGGAIASLVPALFLNPIGISEIALLPARLWSMLLIAFGFRKKTRPWGTVYDSVTKQPLDPAYVVLQDMLGNEVTTSITDLDGRYGFLVEPGTYRILANKTNYAFPSRRLVGRSADEVYANLYFGEPILVERSGEVITKNIPLDPLNFDWNEFAKREKKLMKFYSKRDYFLTRISTIMFHLGFTVSGIALVVSPYEAYNIVIFALYIVLFLLRQTVLKPKPQGKVVEAESGLPLSFALVRVYTAELKKEIIRKVTNPAGTFYCLIPPGRYYVTVERKNADQSYALVHTTQPFTVTKGYINHTFEV